MQPVLAAAGAVEVVAAALAPEEVRWGQPARRWWERGGEGWTVHLGVGAVVHQQGMVLLRTIPLIYSIPGCSRTPSPTTS